MLKPQANTHLWKHFTLNKAQNHIFAYIHAHVYTCIYTHIQTQDESGAQLCQERPNTKAQSHSLRSLFRQETGPNIAIDSAQLCGRLESSNSCLMNKKVSTVGTLEYCTYIHTHMHYCIYVHAQCTYYCNTCAMYTYTNIHYCNTCMHTYILLYTNSFIHICINTCTCIYIHIYIHRRYCTYMYTHA
jgi:hypothetical protein